jgi:hypothetical protein
MGYIRYVAGCSFVPYTNSTGQLIASSRTEQAGLYSASGTRSTTFDSTTYTLSFTRTTAFGGNTASFYRETQARTSPLVDPPNGFTRRESGSFSISSNGSGILNAGASFTTSEGGSQTTTTLPVEFGVNTLGIQGTTGTTLPVALRKTTTTTENYYGPFDDSATTYSKIIYTAQTVTLSGIKTTYYSDYVITANAGVKSITFKIEWIGYNGSGKQNLGLVYTATANSKTISNYDTVLMETDSFQYTYVNTSFNWGDKFTDSYDGDTYTLATDNIINTTVPSTVTILNRQTLAITNSFSYGFIGTSTQNVIITTANKTSTSSLLKSYSKGSVLTNTEDINAISGLSYSYFQSILTTSLFTEFKEIGGLGKVESFAVRKFISTHASYTYRENYDAPAGAVLSIAPTFMDTFLSVREQNTSNPDTFYTERAFFASFAEPSYVSAYKGYAPPECSLVLLNLIPLTPDLGGLYPSWISVYNGTCYLGYDRSVTSLLSITLNQSASYLGSGSTNVYQTISYFLGNNTNSQTTKTTSIGMRLTGSASSVSRLARAGAQNLDSAYYDSNNEESFAYLAQIPIQGSDVVFTNGLQGNAGYNINNLLMNAYTSNRSTFAGTQVSTFPISTSAMQYPYRNNARIDSFPSDVAGIDESSFAIDLLRYIDPFA